jgi:hypothetical protein
MPEQLQTGLATGGVTAYEDAVRVATIRKRKKIDTALSDATCTPEWFCDLLPLVDLDPCSNPRSRVRSRWSFSLEKKLDGLKLPWRAYNEQDETWRSASVFENFPYSAPLPWCKKSIAEIDLGHVHELIVLCKLDTSTEWWDLITQPAMRAPDSVLSGSASDEGLNLDRIALGEEPTWLYPDIWLFDKRLQHDEHPEIIAQRVAEQLADGKKRRKPPTGKSSNNFCSVVIHHRGALNGAIVPPLELAPVATRYQRSPSSTRVR